jgi:hypothetical protein
MLFVLIMQFVISSPDTFTAILGDLEHKKDVYIHYGTYGPAVEKFFTNLHQSRYLQVHYPSLVPGKAPDGTPPSDHRIATVFECLYYRDPIFRSAYLARLQGVAL